MIQREDVHIALELLDIKLEQPQYAAYREDNELKSLLLSDLINQQMKARKIRDKI